MKIEINFTNKWLYSLIAIVVVLGLGVGVYAVVNNPYPYTETMEGSWHSGDKILVDVDGVEKTLQDAIDGGALSSIVSVPSESITSTAVTGSLSVSCVSGVRTGCSGGVNYNCGSVVKSSGTNGCEITWTGCYGSSTKEVHAFCLG